MRFIKFLAFFAGLAALPAAAADTVGNGGDPLRLIFLKGREHASVIAARIQFDHMPPSTLPDVRNWLEQNHTALAADIAGSGQAWTVDDQQTCAFTAQSPKAVVLLSFPSCRQTVSSAVEAGQVLVHESVHHFAIGDEAFADAVALAVYRTWERASVPGDQSFRYNPRERHCENPDGEIGYNPQFIGECGDFMSKDLSNVDLSSKQMRGANLSFADLLGTKLGLTNLRGADLSFAKLRRVDMHQALLEDTDLRHATLEWGGMGRGVQERLFFGHANMADAQLSSDSETLNADFSGADLTRAKIRFNRTNYRSQFTGANLTDATIRCVSDCYTVDMSGANLSGTVLIGGFRVESWVGACYSPTSQLGLKPEEFNEKGLVPCPTAPTEPAP